MTQLAPRGRKWTPTRHKADGKRVSGLHIVFTEEEDLAIASMAAKSNMSRSGYVREVVLDRLRSGIEDRRVREYLEKAREREAENRRLFLATLSDEKVRQYAIDCFAQLGLTQ